MLHVQRLFILAPIIVSLLAGCPGPPTSDGPRIPAVSDDTGGSTAETTTASSDGGSGGSPATIWDPGTGGATTSVADIATTWDSLSVEYPGCDEPVGADSWRAEVLRLVNQERAREGLDPLTPDATLEEQATQYACEMIYYDFFAHENPATGSTLADRTADFGYEYWVIGENLAAGQPDPATAVEGWMNSPDHRDNILNPTFTELGVGVRAGGEYLVYWVQEFGRPRSAGPYTSP